MACSLDSIGVRGRGLSVVAREDGSGQTAYGGSDRGRQLRLLHQLLIEPIADLLPANPEARVIFIPHESLFLVPFPALVDGRGKYLIEKHTILTSPAIQVLDFTRLSRAAEPGVLQEGSGGGAGGGESGDAEEATGTRGGASAASASTGC